MKLTKGYEMCELWLLETWCVVGIIILQQIVVRDASLNVGALRFFISGEIRSVFEVGKGKCRLFQCMPI
ncbi:hypothetical protein DMA11_23845 [Marinilabiliaceae bacterium JC017]|nr:hypothetical protein DMA11_23845 [Marinilabiliaceae bacterium JC017]